MVFVDISGFTKLSEKLARHGKIGAEEMADAINRCFTELLAVAYEEDGSLLKFGGDALLLLFADGTPEEHATRACRAAAGMRQRLREVGRIDTAGGRVTLRMSVGVHTGTFHLFLVGESHRELIVTGPGASEVVTMEGTADAGEIVVSSRTASLVPASCIGLAKEPGWLLRSGPRGDPPGLVSVIPPVDDELLRRSVPAALRELLLYGAPEPEHRQVAVAFLHLDGTDDLISHEGPAAFAIELDRLVRDVQGAVDANDVCFLGTDVDHDGGKIILTAGAPKAAGNDEERLLIALREIASAHRMIPVRIGVHRGHVFVGEIGPSYRRTFTVMGDVVNLAARVMAKAEPGQVLVTGDVLARSRLAFVTSELEPFMVKGKSQPVVAHELGDVVADSVSVEARAARLPLAGRAKELVSIEGAIAAARSGRGSLLDVVGEAGLGKTRLTDETVTRADGFSLWTIHCHLYGASTPYAAFKRPLREALEIRASDSDQAAAERVRQVVHELVPHLEPWIPLLRTPLDVPLEDNGRTAALDDRFRRERIEEITGELLAALLPRPALVTVEDAHWMDEASADLLRRLALNIEQGPWLVMVTRRPAPGGFRGDDLDNVSTLVLEPLDPGEAEEAFAAAVEDDPLPPHRVRELVQRSGGNPMFLTELLIAVRQGGDLDALPGSIEELVTAQIDALRPADRRLLRYASVLGDTFSEGLARVVLAYEFGDFPRDVWRYLEPFLEWDRADTLRFRNETARAVAYEGLSFRRRRHLHAAVGESIERFSPDADDEAEILSLHFLRARDHLRAWRYSRVAASRAAAIYANIDAATFYERALDAARDLPTVTDAERLATYESLGEVRERAGLYREAGHAFAQARRLCDIPTCRARLMLKQARIEDTTGRSSQGLRWLTRAASLLAGHRDVEARAVRAQIHAWYGAIRISQGRFRDAVRWCERAIEDAKASGEKDALAHALYVSDWANLELGRPELASHADEILSLYGELGDLSRQGDTYNMLGAFAYWDGRWSHAVELYERSREIQMRAGDVVSAAIGTANIAEILADQGRLVDAETLAREAIRIFRTSRYRYMLAFTVSVLGRIESRLGRHDEARGHLEDALAMVREGGDQLEEVATLGRLAEDAVLRGRPEEAIGAVDAAFARAGSIGGASQLEPVLFRARGYARVQLGDLDGAREDLGASLTVATERGGDYEIALTVRALEALARARGDPTDEGQISSADDTFTRLGVTWVPSPPTAPT